MTAWIQMGEGEELMSEFKSFKHRILLRQAYGGQAAEHRMLNMKLETRNQKLETSSAARFCRFFLRRRRRVQGARRCCTIRDRFLLPALSPIGAGARVPEVRGRQGQRGHG